jgi:CRP/FNR family transcriptional regulator, cyclic AMP receptor protein
VTPTDALLQTTVFGDLSREPIAALLPAMRMLSLARGQLAFAEGDAADALFVVADGQLKQYTTGRDGTELIFTLALPGDLFGQVGVFDPSGRRSASAEAMAPSEVVKIGREPLLEFFTQNPLAMRRMFEHLSLVARGVGRTLFDVAHEEIRARVAQALLRVALEHSETTHEGLRIPVRLSQATLGSIVGATRENVNRALAALMAAGHLSHHNGFYVVHRRAALEELGDGK